MRTILILLFSLLSFVLRAQEPYILNRDVHVIFKNSDAVKAYEKVEDCIRFQSRTKETGIRNQRIRLYYREDSTAYMPSSAMLVDELRDPEPLDEKHLAVDTIYIVMQTHHPLADRAYEHLEDGQAYIDRFKSEVVKIPYFYRDENSYKEVYRIKAERLKKR